MSQLCPSSQFENPLFTGLVHAASPCTSACLQVIKFRKGEFSMTLLPQSDRP